MALVSYGTLGPGDGVRDFRMSAIRRFDVHPSLEPGPVHLLTIRQLRGKPFTVRFSPCQVCMFEADTCTLYV